MEKGWKIKISKKENKGNRLGRIGNNIGGAVDVVGGFYG